MITAYQMTINNCSHFLRAQGINNKSGIDAFQISEVLAIAFGFSKESVMDDLIDSSKKALDNPEKM